jgi:hypothetical protein
VIHLKTASYQGWRLCVARLSTLSGSFGTRSARWPRRRSSGNALPGCPHRRPRRRPTLRRWRAGKCGEIFRHPTTIGPPQSGIHTISLT